MFKYKDQVKDFLEYNPTCLEEGIIRTDTQITVFNPGLTLIVSYDVIANKLTAWMKDEVRTIDLLDNDLTFIKSIDVNDSGTEVAVVGTGVSDNHVLIFDISNDNYIKKNVLQTGVRFPYNTVIYYHNDFLYIYLPKFGSVYRFDQMHDAMIVILPDQTHVVKQICESSVCVDDDNIVLVDIIPTNGNLVINKVSSNLNGSSKYNFKIKEFIGEHVFWHSELDLVCHIDDNKLYIAVVYCKEPLKNYSDYKLKVTTTIVDLNTGALYGNSQCNND